MESKSLKFLSWQWNVLLALIPGFLLIRYTFLQYGLNAQEVFTRGTWLVLGGFSLFYPTGLFILVFALFLIVGLMCSLKQFILTQDTQGHLTVTERVWGIVPSTRTIDLNVVKFIKLESGRFGIKLAWVIILGAHAAYLMNDGLHLLLSPFLFGNGTENAMMYINTGLIDLLMLLLIALPGEDHLEMHTAEGFYLMRFHAWPRQSTIIQKIQAVLGDLGIPESQGSGEKLCEEKPISPKSSAFTNKLLVYGIILWVLALIARVYDIYAGMPLRLALYFAGWVFFLYGLKSRLMGRKSIQKINNDPKDTQVSLEVHLHAISAQTHLLLKKLNATETKTKSIVVMLPSTIIIGILACILLMGWTLAAWIRFTVGAISMIGFTILFIFIDCGLILLFLDLLFEPVLGISIPANGCPDTVVLYQVHVQAYLGIEGHASLHQKLRFWARWQTQITANPREMKQRMIIVIIALLVGIICAFF